MQVTRRQERESRRTDDSGTSADIALPAGDICQSLLQQWHRKVRLAYVVHHWALARGSISVAAGARCQSAATAKLQWGRPAVRRWSGFPKGSLPHLSQARRLQGRRNGDGRRPPTGRGTSGGANSEGDPGLAWSHQINPSPLGMPGASQ